jgi:hypothetical protein
MHVK